jgi:tetratricopeptide (TPR) repeat protein
MILVPLQLLGLLELGLRLVGVGFPTEFFLQKTINDKPVLVENDQFGLRFFPPELARTPSPLVMEARKPSDTCRIFVLGESAALGDPEPAFGFGRYLEVLLRDRFPQTRFEVICTAMTAINSHVIVPIAEECARREGDIWVVYMGNNEFVGPFGPSTVFGPQLPPMTAIHFGLILKKTRIGQLLSRWTVKRPDQQNWGGMKMFLDHQVPPADPRKAEVYGFFRENLESVLAAARKGGAKVVLSTIAVNLKDCPPFASEHARTPEASKPEWDQLYASARRAQNAGDTPGALSNFQAAAQLDPSFAEMQFHWARSFLSASNSAQALTHFGLARDDDSLPFRADGPLNAVIREVPSEHAAEGVRLVESDVMLARHDPDGIPGRVSFFEHVHLNFEGNYQLARAVADSVAGLLPDRTKAGAKQTWAPFEQCARALALTPWDRRRVYETLLRRLAEPPFESQMDHSSEMDSIRQEIASARAACTPQALKEARQVYADAIAASPNDLYLRGDFAKLAEDTGDIPEAIAQWTALRDLIPFAPGPHYYLARVLRSRNQIDESLKELAKALEIRPDLPEALEEKGRALIQAKRPGEALEVLEQAETIHPRNARLFVAQAQALAEVGRRPDAVRQLQRAVQLQPGYWEAHYLLGVEYAFDGNLESAAEQFSFVVRLSPNYPLGHLNLGIALAKLNRPTQAISQFEETLRLDPSNQKATDYLRALTNPQHARH